MLSHIHTRNWQLSYLFPWFHCDITLIIHLYNTVSKKWKALDSSFWKNLFPVTPPPLCVYLPYTYCRRNFILERMYLPFDISHTIYTRVNHFKNKLYFIFFSESVTLPMISPTYSFNILLLYGRYYSFLPSFLPVWILLIGSHFGVCFWWVPPPPLGKKLLAVNRKKLLHNHTFCFKVLASVTIKCQ